MYLGQTVKIMKTTVPLLNLLILELTFMKKEKTKLKIKMAMLSKVRNFKIAKSENGPPSIGKVISKAVLLSQIQDKKQMVFQKHLLLVHPKSSNVGN